MYFHIEYFPNWDLSPQSCAYHAYAITDWNICLTMRYI